MADTSAVCLSNGGNRPANPRSIATVGTEHIGVAGRAQFGDSIGVATNNVAEYRALVAALEWARAHGHRAVHVRSDSLLLVQQMLGRYKVKHPGLQPLHAKARLLAREVGRVTYEHVGRALNAHADRLANQAMDDSASRS